MFLILQELCLLFRLFCRAENTQIEENYGGVNSPPSSLYVTIIKIIRRRYV
nr:MAG TPA: hypothetical protein [Crassvirales sp.]